MSLKNRINEDMKAAMRAKEADRLGTIRLLLAAIKQREVDERRELDDVAITGVIEKMLKQRRDSIFQFEQGGRQDLADKEKFEVRVLQEYMPKALGDEEIQAAVIAAISSQGARGPQDMGKVMAVLKGELAGRADMGKVSALVKAKLSS